MRKLSPLALAVAGSFFVSPFVFAAEEVAKEEQKIEKIQVTGSRIKGVDLEGTQPLVIISADDIKNSGASTIYDLLKDVGQLRGGSGTFSTSESGATSTSTPAGQAAASLRGLGPAATLTLINGRRVAASSFATRTPEMQLTDATLGGVTTAIGVLGTDATTRTLTNLLAKAHALDSEGITTYCHTGSYEIPCRTLTGNITDDLILIDKFIGVGEIAISDHRSSQPTTDEIRKVAAAARVGGMLAGKSGVIDFTTSTTDFDLKHGEVAAAAALAEALAFGIKPMQLTLSSDGNASLPIYNDEGVLLGLQVGTVQSLYQSAREAITQHKVNITDAICSITAAPAAILGLKQKGRIATGLDADIVLLRRDDLAIDSVIGKGKLLVQQGEALVKGTFEQ
jgi:beta-aspartyl-dipeptidase (metallo-type)